MKLPFLFFGSLLSIACAATACGGSVEPIGSGSPSPSTTSGGSTPPSQGTTPPPSGTGSPVHPTPSPLAGNYSAQAAGCSNFTVFATHSSGRKFLVIDASKEKLGIASLGETATVELSAKSAAESAAVHVDTYPSQVQQAPYCTDIIIDVLPEPTKATAIAGTATFTITAQGREGDSYGVTVTLKNVVVRAPDGSTESVPDVTYTTVNVGWLPG